MPTTALEYAASERVTIAKTQSVDFPFGPAGEGAIFVSLEARTLPRLGRRATAATQPARLNPVRPVVPGGPIGPIGPIRRQSNVPQLEPAMLKTNVND